MPIASTQWYITTIQIILWVIRLVQALPFAKTNGIDTLQPSHKHERGINPRRISQCFVVDHQFDHSISGGTEHGVQIAT